MKYINAKFKGYIGFYNGMGLNEIEIDFSKCMHKIILITGKNGSGKSTLMNHLNPFPDSSSSFIPNQDAEKDLTLFHEGETYTIQIYSAADINGKRKTTKAYIQKNGLELNENGNVQSYKDIIFSEFEMDSNYISLSKLSSNDRGLGDKTPAERKKFVANIIDNLEIYNDMYKTLNKKSLIYKSHVNTLHTKIQNIGTKDSLAVRLNNLTSRQNSINSRILELNNIIVSIQTKNNLDEDEAKKIQEAIEEESRLKIELDSISSSIDLLERKSKIKRSDIESKYNEDKSLESEYRLKISEITSNWKNANERLSNIGSEIHSIEAELESSDYNNDISDRYNSSNEKLKELRSELKKYGIKEDLSLIFKIAELIKFVEKFDLAIERFYDGLCSTDVVFLVKEYTKTYILDITKEKDELMKKKSDNDIEIARYNMELELLSTLSDRPSNCKIDKCPFISNALTLKSTIKYNPSDMISKLEEENSIISKRCTEIDQIIDICRALDPKKMELDNIRKSILDNKDIISIFYPDFIDTFDESIINLNTFSDIRDNRVPTAVYNILLILDSEIRSNELLSVEYKGYRDKIQLLNSYKSKLDSLKSEETEMIKLSSELKSEKDKYEEILSSLVDIISLETQYISEYNKYLSISHAHSNISTIIAEYNKKSSKALEEYSKISIYREEIDKLKIEIDPINREISNINGMLTMLDSYYSDYETYKSSFDTIEILKKYCSPTGGGIQTIFMQMYMSKTKEIANQVLAMLFNGAYHLEDFIINSNEFRIPFVGEGLPVDDISSGSSAQIAMMGMIINLTLLHQASTKFNIAQLDEITGPLDSYNNSQFTSVLFYCMDILKIDQLFMISHSTDTDNTFADIIKLKGYDNYESSIQSGNIIWNYDDIIKTQ